jgi:hypothetical protein
MLKWVLYGTKIRHLIENDALLLIFSDNGKKAKPQQCVV